MSLLLKLPQEIRDEILMRVISYRRPVPDPFQPSSTDLQRTELHDLRYKAWGEGRGVCYEPGNPTVSATSLLLINHQLHREVLDVLRRFPHAKSYTIDIVLVDDVNLWVTWLHIPSRSIHLDTVHACFRACGFRGRGNIQSEENTTLDPRYRWRERIIYDHMDSGPPEIVWQFYSTLERFLKCGPVGQLKGASNGHMDLNITVKVLELDFLSPPDLDAHDTRTYEEWKLNREQRYSAGTVRAEWFLDIVYHELNGLLSMGYHTAEFGAILYERIGEIRVLLDGTLIYQYDLANYLASLDPKGPTSTFGMQRREERVLYFHNWRRTTLRRRQEAGLPVCSLTKDEDDLIEAP